MRLCFLSLTTRLGKCSTNFCYDAPNDVKLCVESRAFAVCVWNATRLDCIYAQLPYEL